VEEAALLLVVVVEVKVEMELTPTGQVEGRKEAGLMEVYPCQLWRSLPSHSFCFTPSLLLLLVVLTDMLAGVAAATTPAREKEQEQEQEQEQAQERSCRVRCGALLPCLRGGAWVSRNCYSVASPLSPSHLSGVGSCHPQPRY
jgi:hypothetical protein